MGELRRNFGHVPPPIPRPPSLRATLQARAPDPIAGSQPIIHPRLRPPPPHLSRGHRATDLVHERQQLLLAALLKLPLQAGHLRLLVDGVNGRGRASLGEVPTNTHQHLNTKEGMDLACTLYLSVRKKKK